MIKFRISIGIPGHLDAEDELSNVLQGELEEEELMDAMEGAVRSWVACWMPHLRFGEVKVRIEQE